MTHIVDAVRCRLPFRVRVIQTVDGANWEICFHALKDAQQVLKDPNSTARERFQAAAQLNELQRGV